MPERFLGIQTPHDSGRTGSLPFRPGLHPARPPLSCDHTKSAVWHPVGRRRTGSDHHREVGWRDCPRHKGRTGSTCSIVPVGVPKTFSSS